MISDIKTMQQSLVCAEGMSYNTGIFHSETDVTLK